MGLHEGEDGTVHWVGGSEDTEEGRYSDFVMWSSARSAHSPCYTHFQNTYLMSSVVSEYMWKVSPWLSGRSFKLGSKN